MANTLGFYNPAYYANEALIALEKALGMAGRVHRGYDQERRSFELGDTINIKRPSTFTANDAPSNAQDIATQSVSIVLNKWREVKFKLTDKELAFSGQRIVNDHIRPAAYALADDIDQNLVSLYKDVPWFYDMNAGGLVSDLTGTRQTLFDNRVPLGDPSMVHFMIDGARENAFLQLSAFSQWQGAGNQGVDTQLRGSLGVKFGLETFANQNVATHTAGTCNDVNLLVNNGAGYAAGVTSMNIDAADAGVAGTLVAGDTFVIAGNSQRYAVTALNTAAGNAFTAVTFTPGLAAAVVDNAVITVRLSSTKQCMAWHRNAFALVVAPLPEMGKDLGAKVATITDPITGLSIRSRIYYVGNSSEVHVALDVLYGFKTLDGNLAVRSNY